jgi:predicted PurR-regulated permease PerM
MFFFITITYKAAIFSSGILDFTVKICKQISHEKNYELNILEKTLQSLQLEQDNGKNKVTEENAKSLQDKVNVIENKLSKKTFQSVLGSVFCITSFFLVF